MLAKTTNHDFFIGNKAFFFDLSIWDDETPNDDPHQPLGTDRVRVVRPWYQLAPGTPPGIRPHCIPAASHMYTASKYRRTDRMHGPAHVVCG